MLGGCDPPLPDDAAATSELATTELAKKKGGGGGGGGGDAPPEQLPSPEKVCPETRWVGHIGDGPCPAPLDSAHKGGSWVLDPLVPAGADSAFAHDPNVQAMVQRFAGTCVYEWSPSDDGAAPLVDALPTDAGGPGWLQRDCHVVVPQGGVSGPMLDAMHTDFLASVGHDPAAIQVDPNHPPVRIAVVDDVRRKPSEPLQPHVRVDQGTIAGQIHGVGMRQLLLELTCGAGGECVSEVHSHLALTLNDDGAGVYEDRVYGGRFGYLSRLAGAILDAALRHRLEAPGQRLIINLSVGWDGRLTQSGPGATAAAAVLAAIEIASCDGALVLAAAGNDLGGNAGDAGPPAGPLLPAGWAELPRVCPGQKTTKKPGALLHAVGAVNHTDRTLAIHRTGARPRLVAPGYLAVSDLSSALIDVGGYVDQPTGAPASAAAVPYRLERQLTGTSVATIVASAIAARAWQATPARDADAVMQALYDASPALASKDGGAPDFCLFGPPCREEVRRLSACALAQSADITTQGGCVSGVTQSATAVLASIFDGPPDIEGDASALQPAFTVSQCGAVLASDGQLPPYPCPATQLLNGNALPTEVDPQPETDPCTECRLTITQGQPVFLQMAIDGRLDHQVLGCVLRLDGPSPVMIDLRSTSPPLDPIREGGRYDVFLPGWVRPDFTRATLEFTLEGRYGSPMSAESQVQIVVR